MNNDNNVCVPTFHIYSEENSFEAFNKMQNNDFVLCSYLREEGKIVRTKIEVFVFVVCMPVLNI